ncbi:GNAT family N-acetyltransferase [Bacillus subtilis]|uniref:GNAT family N-acetyltransferase n=1 Tax=Pseudochrobactrum asaccharolyticum TaxID=354351 RepID=UPI001F19CA01|nr:GNAT family N-acetyltransferase [Pseudochrobactrum asaccharolyticum]MCF7646104.1 GNAT family N-acetyltransferase [Pseudochrobactrum asaccharolyticum]MCF7672850.1 GNAT family N-acetyltransferase [Bacillus subtilis]
MTKLQSGTELNSDSKQAAPVADDGLKGAGLTGDYGADVVLRDSPVQLTERLVLRLPHEEDIDALAVLADNVNVARMLARLPYPYSRDHAVDFIKLAASGAIGQFAYAITLAETGEFIGSITLHDHKYGSGYEIGYWLGEPYWGKGYATEATTALIDLSFRELSLEQIYISAQSRNEGSKRVIEKCGFRHTGSAIGHSVIDGDVLVECYIMTRQQWLEMRGAGQ